MKREDKRRIIRFARSGSPERAWSLLTELAAEVGDDPDVLVLKGRITKDRAKRADGGEAAALYAKAADLYEQAAHEGFLSYPLINAASLALLAGQARRCEKLARRVLEVIESDPDEAETPYWHAATQAEALLLLGEEVEARAAMTRAMQRAPEAWEDHAATIGQLGLIAAEKGLPANWLDRLRPPRSLHFAGIIGIAPDDAAPGSRVAEWLEAENVGFAWGALAAGSDIVIAEALLSRGAQLNLVLPCQIEAFRAASVEAAGSEWAARFDAILPLCESIEMIEASSSPDAASVKLAESLASGLALHNARNLQSEALALRLVDATRDGDRPAALRTMAIPAKQASATVLPVPAQSPLTILLHEDGAGRYSKHFTNPADAWQAAKEATAAGKQVALDFAYLAPGDEPSRDMRDRMAQLSALAPQGSIMTSRSLGFALLAHDPAIHVEDHGELRNAGGLMPICALS